MLLSSIAQFFANQLHYSSTCLLVNVWPHHSTSLSTSLVQIKGADWLQTRCSCLRMCARDWATYIADELSRSADSTTICTLMINISTCTSSLAWRSQLWRVWLAASLTFLVGVLLDDYNSTELIWFGLRAMLHHLTGNNCSLSIGSVRYFAELIIATQFSSVFQPPLLRIFSVFRTLPLG